VPANLPEILELLVPLKLNLFRIMAMLLAENVVILLALGQALGFGMRE
jgi:hypothetical protein